ncbi:hypothetical protein PM082_018610 [Marasmius tenuissimus]|nr:hypothetical protein PM082_018610 [Marasmius tenuissimus]
MLPPRSSRVNLSRRRALEPPDCAVERRGSQCQRLLIVIEKSLSLPRVLARNLLLQNWDTLLPIAYLYVRGYQCHHVGVVDLAPVALLVAEGGPPATQH